MLKLSVAICLMIAVSVAHAARTGNREDQPNNSRIARLKASAVQKLTQRNISLSSEQLDELTLSLQTIALDSKVRSANRVAEIGFFEEPKIELACGLVRGNIAYFAGIQVGGAICTNLDSVYFIVFPFAEFMAGAGGGIRAGIFYLSADHLYISGDYSCTTLELTVTLGGSTMACEKYKELGQEVPAAMIAAPNDYHEYTGESLAITGVQVGLSAQGGSLMHLTVY